MALTERTDVEGLFDVLSRAASVAPAADGILTRNARLSYGEVHAQATALAAALAGLGIGAGDRVAIVLPGCPEFVVSFFALARIGAVAVPLSPRLAEAELRYMLRHSEAVAAVTIETFDGIDFLQRFEDMLPHLPELQYLVTVGEEDLWYDDRIFQFEDLLSAGKGREAPPVREDPSHEVAAIVYTSGTTGKPKGVVLSHGNLLYTAGVTVRGLGLTPADRVFGVTALFHVFGLGPGIVGTAMAGAALILQEEFDGDEALDLIEELGATVHYGVPTVFAAELRALQRRPRDLSTLRLGLAAGGPMAESLFARVEEELCPGLLTAYSLTEAGSILALVRPDDPVEKRRFTVGRIADGTEVRILEADGTQLPVESLGELTVRGPGVMRGYYRQPNETRSTLGTDGFLRTGDLGILDEEGFIHLVGRRKDVIIRGGENVHPREVEDRLHAHPAVREGAVVGIRDELLGEAIFAAVVPVEGAIVTGEELRTWCGDTLAEHKVPDFVRFVDSLPMTGTGKVRRVDLARLIEAEGAGSAE